MARGFYIGGIVSSDVDGPGTRAIIHFAGCDIGCAGCFNPHTHATAGDAVWGADAHTSARAMVEVSPLISISGGEPTDQIEALFALLVELRANGAQSVVMFTGRRIEWLRIHRPLWSDIERLQLVDIVVDGPFMQNQIEENPVMRGSSNQRIIALTGVYSEDDFRQRDIQVLVEGGKLVITGFPDEELLAALNMMAG